MRASMPWIQAKAVQKRPSRGIVLACLLGVLPLAAQQAAMRVDATIRQRPAESDLGVYIQIPDGGLLPKHPLIDVRDTSGQPLENLILWHTPADALGLVFRPPTSSDNNITITIRAARMLPRKPAATLLKPSLFMFTRSGTPSLKNARKMASEWPPAQGAFGDQTDRIGIRWNPFGPDDHFSSWFTGWFKLDQRETLYLATISDEGSEVHLDGSLFVAWPGIHTRKAGAKGQHGKKITLDPGWHRIDYFHFEVTGNQEMCLVWKREGEGDKLPTFMEGKAWGQTGRAEPTQITTADHRTVGWVSGHLQAVGYLWLGNHPLNLYRLTCTGVTPTADTSVTWDFGHGRTRANTLSCDWFGQPTAALAVATPTGISRQTFRLTSFVAPRAHSLNKPADRLLYRQTFLDMLRAVPKDQNPCTAWSGDLWTTLVAILDTYKGGPILLEIFDRAWPTVKALPVDQRQLLEDRFAETLRLVGDTNKQLAWIERFRKNDRDRLRQFRWREERIACYLYDQGDVDAAGRAARAMRAAANSPVEIQHAILRLGDVEMMAGNREQAAKFYDEAQTRYRNRNRLGIGGTAGSPFGFTPSRPVKASAAANKKPRSLRSVKQNLTRSDAWKLYAVNDAAQASTIRAYLAQGAVAEAFETLAQWENDTPMSKIGGDFPMVEARVYAHVGDYRRTAAILAAYRRTDVMTSQLPSAMDLHLKALMQLKRFPEARVLAEEAVKRFPGLAVAQRAEHILETTQP